MPQKIAIEEGVLEELAQFFESQQQVMQKTRSYLEEHGHIDWKDFGLLLLIVFPIYEISWKLAISGFGIGANLVEKRRDLVKKYADEVKQLEESHHDLIRGMLQALENSGKGFGGAGGAAAGAAAGAVHHAVPVPPPDFTHQEREYPTPPPNVGTSPGGYAPPPPVSEVPPPPPPPLHEVFAPPPPPPVIGPPPIEAVLAPPPPIDHAVWLDRAAADPLGRSPELLKSLWQARTPVSFDFGSIAQLVGATPVAALPQIGNLIDSSIFSQVSAAALGAISR
ncbi:hypothetical protein [Protaetiibacter intestinalis]|uniref:Uncharacterized protein n=1 Tax=Protaetiibacter intestinalis TaxID=2419774 RepID=A0A387B9G5_9MICO|nr:hypothetical protein [Protaetiibacter intestinalis]AYF97746.1 hypothetical protein D7I47_05420 [Protaetiibacter intestinalis]